MLRPKAFGKVTVLAISNDCNIRARGFFDKKSKVWFFAEDLLKSLGYNEPAMTVVQKYCENAVIGTMTIDGRKENYMVVSGGDMWNLALYAPSERAKGFQRFVHWHTVDYNEETDNALCIAIDEK